MQILALNCEQSWHDKYSCFMPRLINWVVLYSLCKPFVVALRHISMYKSMYYCDNCRSNAFTGVIPSVEFAGISVRNKCQEG